MLLQEHGDKKDNFCYGGKKPTLKQPPWFCFCKTEKALGSGNNGLQQDWFFQTDLLKDCCSVIIMNGFS